MYNPFTPYKDPGGSISDLKIGNDFIQQKILWLGNTKTAFLLRRKVEPDFAIYSSNLDTKVTASLLRNHKLRLSSSFWLLFP
jgi:hypothetical protein